MTGSTHVPPAILAALIDVEENLMRTLLQIFSTAKSKANEIRFLTEDIHPFDAELYYTNIHDVSSAISGTKPSEICEKFVAACDLAITTVLGLITEIIEYKFDDTPDFETTLKKGIALAHEWFKYYRCYIVYLYTPFLSYSNLTLRRMKEIAGTFNDSIIASNTFSTLINSLKSATAAEGVTNDPNDYTDTLNGKLKALLSGAFPLFESSDSSDLSGSWASTGSSTGFAHHVAVMNDAARFIFKEMLATQTSVWKEIAVFTNPFNSRYATPDIAAAGLANLVEKFAVLLGDMPQTSAPFSALEREFAKFEVTEILTGKLEPITDGILLKLIDSVRVFDGNQSRKPASITSHKDTLATFVEACAALFAIDDDSRVAGVSEMDFTSNANVFSSSVDLSSEVYNATIFTFDDTNHDVAETVVLVFGDRTDSSDEVVAHRASA